MFKALFQYVPLGPLLLALVLFLLMPFDQAEKERGEPVQTPHRIS
jgi:hypothetical protein